MSRNETEIGRGFMRLSEMQLNEIEERSNLATPGPWKVYVGIDDENVEKEMERRIGTAYDHPQLKGPRPVVTSAVYRDEPHYRIYLGKEDANFIAAAREDIPNLLAHIKNMEEQLKEYKEREFEAICEDPFALKYGEFEDLGVEVIKDELIRTQGWWEYYEVEFTFDNQVYAFEYREHTAPVCADNDITKAIYKK